MAVLALERDSAQAAAIRHIVCDVVHAKLTLVGSVDEALRALHADRPDLVLLPTLVTPAEEAELLGALRELPEGSNIETLTTPVLKALEEPTSPRGWRAWVTRTPWQPARADEARLFAERLAWSLQHAGEGRAVAAPDADAYEAVTTAAPAAVEPVALEQVATLEPIAPLEPAAMESAVLEPVAAEWEFARFARPPIEAAPSEASPPAASAGQRQLHGPDRRAARRFSSEELHGLRSARLKHGPDVSVVDVSADGALVTSRMPLKPNSEGTLEIKSGQGQSLVPFRVLRCRIDSLDGTPSYAGAFAFNQPLDMADLVLPAPVDPKADLRPPKEGIDVVLKRTLDLHLVNDDCDEEWKLPPTDLKRALSDVRDAQSDQQADRAIGDLISVVLQILDDEGKSLSSREAREARVHVERHLNEVLPELSPRFSDVPLPATSPDAEGLYFQVPIRLGRPARVLNVSVPHGTMLEDWQFRLLKSSACLSALLEGTPTRGERRRHARLNGPFEGRRCGLIDTPIQVRDISEGGCFVHSMLETEVGRRLTLEVEVPGEGVIAVKGEVANSRSDFGFGVRFVEVPDETRSRLANLIAKSMADAAVDGIAVDHVTTPACFDLAEASAC